MPIAASMSVRRDGMRAILEVMSAAATLVEALEPLRADPARAAVLLDIDGTLAPIVRHADDAHVPEPTRAQLIAVAKRYGVVALHQRPPGDDRAPDRLARLDRLRRQPRRRSCCAPAAPRSRSIRRSPRTSRRCRDFAREVWTRDLQRLRVRAEDKRAIAAFHWRGAPDEDAAEDAVRDDRRRAPRRPG